MSDRMPNKIYLLRVIYSLMAIAQIFIEREICASPVPIDGSVIAALLIYPHVGHLLFGRFNTRRFGQVPFLADGVVVGVLMSALGFQLIPSVVFATINLFTWTILGGSRLVLGGLLGLLVGILIYPPTILPLEQFGQTCVSSNAFASAILAIYLVAVGAIIFQRVGELRHAQETLLLSRDNATSARTAAESALLAALPRQISGAGGMPTADDVIRVEDALVARICLSTGDPETLHGVWFNPSPWIRTVEIVERALTRRGIEIIKTQGLSILAFADGDDSVDRFVDAVVEARRHLRDHADFAHLATATRGVPIVDLSIAVEVGQAQLRIVQPERLDVDAFGAVMPRLDDAVRNISTFPPGVLLLSATARGKLSPRQDIELEVSTPSNDGGVALSLK